MGPRVGAAPAAGLASRGKRPPRAPVDVPYAEIVAPAPRSGKPPSHPSCGLAGATALRWAAAMLRHAPALAAIAVLAPAVACDRRPPPTPAQEATPVHPPPPPDPNPQP